MGVLFVLAIAIPIVWCIVSTVRAVARARRLKWWLVFGILVAAGIALGWFCGNWEYDVGDKMRIGGFPVPMVFFRLEDGRWTDFPLPTYVSWLAFLTDVLAGIAIVLLPFRVVLRKKS